MATVIVPACNESSVIEDCLNSIVVQPGIDHVIVACNGCDDNTAAIVRTRYPSVVCLDLAAASKTDALNAAEKTARELGVTYPIFYIDADTQLGVDAIVRIVDAMEGSTTLLAAPTPIVDTGKSSWLVKAYYKVWLDLPYVRDGVVGTCSFIVSEQGRERFDEFADVLGDDGFVRRLFNSDEISNIEGAEIYIRAPKDILSLVRVKTRSRLGNLELLAHDESGLSGSRKYGRVMMNELVSKYALSACVYILIALIIRVRASRQFCRLDQYHWERDASSR